MNQSKFFKIFSIISVLWNVVMIIFFLYNIQYHKNINTNPLISSDLFEKEIIKPIEIKCISTLSLLIVQLFLIYYKKYFYVILLFLVSLMIYYI